MHCCCPLVCCSALVVVFFFGGSVLVSLVCHLNAHADDDETCSEGLSWLKWNMVVSVLSGIAVLNRQKKFITNQRGEALIVKEDPQGFCGCLEIVLGIAWFIWMIVGIVRLCGLDAGCAEGVRDWMIVAVAGGFIVPALGGCCCGILYCLAITH